MLDDTLRDHIIDLTVDLRQAEGLARRSAAQPDATVTEIISDLGHVARLIEAASSLINTLAGSAAMQQALGDTRNRAAREG